MSRTRRKTRGKTLKKMRRKTLKKTRGKTREKMCKKSYLKKLKNFFKGGMAPLDWSHQPSELIMQKATTADR